MTDQQTANAPTTTSQHAPGTPIWTDLGSPNLDASRAFYGSLFGWEAIDVSQPEAGSYTMFTLDGKMVAGLGPLFSPDQPTAWSTYLKTADANATAEAVRKAGGQVVVEPMQVMDAGSMAIFMDPTGAHISAWQPGQHKGADVFNIPGAMCWNELATRDIDTAKKFYGAVFGLEGETSSATEGGPAYTTFNVNGNAVAGGLDMNSVGIPASVPPHWLTYFTVVNCDASVTKVEELGGKVMNPAMDMPIGRFAVVTDQHGAVFAVFQSNQ